MSKLTIVRQALETNPDVTIVNVDEKNYLPERQGSFSHIVDFCVVPKCGLYRADELQAFMIGLVPNLEPTVKNDFYRYSDIQDFGKYAYNLVFGELYFDEMIGEERIDTKRILTLTDEELLNVSGFVDGKRTIDVTEKLLLLRRTLVRPYPNEAIARDILDGKLYSFERISIDDLERYKPNLISS